MEDTIKILDEEGNIIEQQRVQTPVIGEVEVTVRKVPTRLELLQAELQLLERNQIVVRARPLLQKIEMIKKQISEI